MLFSMEQHIAEIWTVDASDCLNIAQSRGLIRKPSPWNLGSQDLPDPSVAEGYLLIFRLKSSVKFLMEQSNLTKNNKLYGGGSNQNEENNHVEQMHRNDKKSSKQRSVEESTTINPLKHSLSPLCSPSLGCSSDDVIEPQYLAIFVKNGSKVASMLSCALMTWRHALRSHDIPQHKGEGKDQSRSGSDYEGLIPTSILKAYVAAIGTCALTDSSNSQSNQFSNEETKFSMNSMSSNENFPISARTVLAAGACRSGLPGLGFLAMRYGLHQ